MGKTPIPGSPGWNTWQDQRLFAPDVDLRETMWRENGHLLFQTGVVESGEDIYVECCLDEFMGEKTADAANAFLDRQREKVVRKVRAVRTITGPFVAALARLEAEFRPRAVSA